MSDNSKVYSGNTSGGTSPIDGSHVPLNADPYANAIITIESEHAHIHEGEGFQISGEAAAIGAGASAYFLIDPILPVHWRDYRFIADGAPVDIELFENPTVTDNGTAITSYNRNRLSSHTAQVVVYSGPTVTDDGTRLYITRIVGTGTGANAKGEVEGLPLEWVVDNGNTYLMKLTNNDTSDVSIIYNFFWYELDL